MHNSKPDWGPGHEACHMGWKLDAIERKVSHLIMNSREMRTSKFNVPDCSLKPNISGNKSKIGVFRGSSIGN